MKLEDFWNEKGFRPLYEIERNLLSTITVEEAKGHYLERYGEPCDVCASNDSSPESSCWGSCECHQPKQVWVEEKPAVIKPDHQARIEAREELDEISRELRDLYGSLGKYHFLLRKRIRNVLSNVYNLLE